jgi:hypothetical protein
MADIGLTVLPCHQRANNSDKITRKKYRKVMQMHDDGRGFFPS